MRLFADDASLFTCVRGVTQTHDKLVKDLLRVTQWAYQWKMVFNPFLKGNCHPKKVVEIFMKCESTLKMMKNNKKSKSKVLPVLEIINFNDFCCDVIKVQL